jgi:hypothetical protein
MQVPHAVWVRVRSSTLERRWHAQDEPLENRPIMTDRMSSTLSFYLVQSAHIKGEVAGRQEEHIY